MVLAFPFFSVAFQPLTFSDEIDAERRRKGSGPEGRAEAPVYREGGGGSGGGGLQPSSSGGGSGGIKLPPWMIIILLILAVLFGGKGLIGQLLGGSSATSNPVPVEETTLANIATEVPTVQSAPVAGFTPPTSSKAGSWTVMLYQDADDEVLEQDVFTDFNEAERVGSTDKVNIVAQLDRFSGAFTGDGNWTSTRRYYVTKDNDLTAIHSKLVADLGELNMSDPATLVDFATWAVKTFPADHYVLILSDHGMGWPGGWTDPAPASYTTEKAPLSKLVGNAMYMDQVDTALGQIRQQTGIDKFDIVGMDACLMSQIEVLDALEPHALYAITSEETEPAVGWAYTAFLQALTQNPGMSAADLSKLVVQSYIVDDQRIVDNQARANFLSELGGGNASASQLAQEIGKDATLAAVDLSKVPALMDSVNALSYAMQNANQSQIASARDYALSFTSVFGKSVPPAYIDLGSFVQILKQQSSDSTVRQLSDQVLSNIRQAVIAEKHGSSRNGATGVAIYFPNSSLYGSPYSGPQSYTVIAKRFTQNSLWDDFLAFHYNGRSFDAATRESVIPASNLPSRAPGLGKITVSPLRLSSDSAAPGQPVTMRADISGINIGNIYLFVGYYDQSSNSIFVADTDFLESPNTQQVDGVYYPKWGDNGAFTVKFDWDPYIFTISDGQKSTVALFTPQEYGATAAEALYSVNGVYTYSSSGDQLNARLNFRDGKLVSVFGITGQGDTGAPHEIIPQTGDTFTILEKWLQLDSQGNVQKTVYQEGQTTLSFTGQPFTWQETYAAQGNYIIGFVVTDLDGNSQEVYGQVTVK
jgi:clostripain